MMIKIYIISKTISIIISGIILSIITEDNKMDNNQYIKPGYKTTEFWAMIVSAFFGILIVFGFITNFESNTMLAYINNISGSLLTVSSVVSYIWSRGKAKGSGNVDYVKLLKDIEKLVNENKPMTYK